jgi:hypothetical protein
MRHEPFASVPLIAFAAYENQNFVRDFPKTDFYDAAPRGSGCPKSSVKRNASKYGSAARQDLHNTALP